jgi:lipoprotein-anchoring transpeptidase ErfK/SrfK
MKNALIIFITILLFFLAVVLLVTPKSLVLKKFSPQAKVDPYAVQESFDKNAQYGFFNNEMVRIPHSISSTYLARSSFSSNVLPAFTGDKRIEVDLTNQRLYGFENSKKVFDFLVSTGKWGRTPTGIFNIWIKLRSTKMEGGSQELGTYYYLPNVPFTMFFANNEIPKWRGYGIHGTYWHNNFGHPMSHGCINMKTEEVEQLFYWALPDLKGKTSIYASEENPGTPIVIYGEAPQE